MQRNATIFQETIAANTVLFETVEILADRIGQFKIKQVAPVSSRSLLKTDQSRDLDPSDRDASRQMRT